MMTTPMMATNTNNPTIAGMKYKSAVDVEVVVPVVPPGLVLADGEPALM